MHRFDWSGFDFDIGRAVRGVIDDPLSGPSLGDHGRLLAGLGILLKGLLDDPLLLREVAERSYVHPLGFKKIALWRNEKNEGLRIHLWPDAPSAIELGDVHDHFSAFRSVVLTHALTFNEYSLVGEGGDYELFNLLPTNDNGAYRLVNNGRTGLRRERVVVVKAGSDYRLSADTLHDTVPSPGAVSLIVQGAMQSKTNIVVRRATGRQDNEPAYLTVDDLAKELVRLERSFRQKRV